MAYNLGPIHPPKAADDIRHEITDWSEMLRTGATIANATASRVQTGIDVAAVAYTDTTTTTTIAGGTDGDQYDIDLTVTTSDGETHTFAITVPVGVLDLGPIRPPKAPSDVRLISINWAKAMHPGDTVALATASRVQAGITAGSVTNDDTTTTVIVYGGTAGEDYRIELSVVTLSGEQFTAAFTVPVR